jgi:conjugative transfer region lipoprotein (TIGR03751 family)
MATNKTAFMITVLSSALCACASSVSTSSIPSQGLTVEQIYSRVNQDNTNSLEYMKRHVKGAGREVNFNDYSNKKTNQRSTTFKALKNPMIPIYIYPHIAQIGDEQIAKPGYTTEFFLFKRNQFALSNERY